MVSDSAEPNRIKAVASPFYKAFSKIIDTLTCWYPSRK